MKIVDVAIKKVDRVVEIVDRVQESTNMKKQMMIFKLYKIYVFNIQSYKHKYSSMIYQTG